MKSGGVCDVSYPTSKLRRGRVQGDGDISPTLTCESGGIVRIEIVNERFFKQAMETLENNDCEVGDTINAFNKTVDKSGCSPTITTRPEGFKTAILPVVEVKKNMDAIKTGKTQEELDEMVLKYTPYASNKTEEYPMPKKDSFINPEKELEAVKPKYRIRKLTPRECWRLMNFSDEDFEKAEKVNSNSQLYKQAGNSICVNVLCAIFSQLGIQGHKRWNEMSLEERRELVYKGTVLEAKSE